LTSNDFSIFEMASREIAILQEVGMKVKIDYDLCMGDRNCNKVCPEVFQYDEDQLISRVLVDEVPEQLEEAVRKAARECVPEAIIIEE